MAEKFQTEKMESCVCTGQRNRGCDMRELRRKKNFACVRIFYWGSRGKTENLDVARIRRERTRN